MWTKLFICFGLFVCVASGSKMYYGQVGGSITLKCNEYFSEVSWKYGSTTIISVGKTGRQTKGSSSFTERITMLGTNLHIRDLKSEDAGTFTCIITDRRKGQTTSDMTLQVFKVSVSVSPASPLLLSSTATLTCDADGSPDKVEWRHNNQDKTAETGTTVTLGNVEGSHGGTWRCLVHYGETQLEASLDIDVIEKTCKLVTGSLVQIDTGNGQVLGVNKQDDIYALYGSTWTQIDGKLKHVTVGQAGIWGVNSANSIYKLVAGGWVQVPGLLKQIDAGGDQFVAGCNDHNVPYCLTVGYVGANSPVSWANLPGNLKYYSCGPYSCWGVNSQDNIFVRKGVDSIHCQGVGDWQHIEGSLSMIEVGGDGSVYGVNSNGEMYRRDSISPCKPEGDSWTHIPLYSGEVKHVSYDAGHLWIILKNDAIYDCTV